MQEWARRSEQAVKDLIGSIYRFVRKAILRSPLIRDTVVWLVEALSPFRDELVFVELISEVASDGAEGEGVLNLNADLDKMVKHHKYSSTRYASPMPMGYLLDVPGLEARL